MKTKIASPGGLEPPTFRLTAERANRLRHRDCSPCCVGLWLCAARRPARIARRSEDVLRRNSKCSSFGMHMTYYAVERSMTLDADGESYSCRKSHLVPTQPACSRSCPLFIMSLCLSVSLSLSVFLFLFLSVAIGRCWRGL